MMKEYATFKYLVDKVAKQIDVDRGYNSVKIKYKIEDSNAPLDIHNETSVRVYVPLKKDNKDLVKMCGIDKGYTFDTKALVLSIPFMSDDMNCDIISNINQKEVMEDQVYMDKETLKVVMSQYTIDHMFQ
ncbi:hypothetical protein H5410_056916 [Solanum commersonii]|uniref:Uncharacterized protein n=1 Tax=Solanum commersonii TaxID=4109 RepID=A0A9J5WPF1_SOLCO|nr:hypothetical protein H5410_056916 [Solanum commersonii]